MPTVAIRRAEPRDLDALIALYDELADDEGSRAAGGQQLPGVLAETIADPDRALLVAELDGRVVGTADVLVVANLTHHGQPWAIVENVVVAAVAQRQGVGRRLMEELLAIARGRGCYKVQLLSGKQREEAHALYRALGFEAVAEGFKAYV